MGPTNGNMQIIDSTVGHLPELLDSLSELADDLAEVQSGIIVARLTQGLLNREVGGLTNVQRGDIDSTNLSRRRALVVDSNGTLGVFLENIPANPINPASSVIMTITTSVTQRMPARLGNVNTNADLPANLQALAEITDREPVLDDYMWVIEDETMDDYTVEWRITEFTPPSGSTNPSITWGNPLVINRGSFQQQSNASDAGRVLTAGNTDGTFGASVGIDLSPQMGSSNLARSHSVWSVHQRADGAWNMSNTAIRTANDNFEARDLAFEIGRDNPWAFLQDAIREGTHMNICAGDYIDIPINTAHFTENLRMEVAGVNTYTGSGDTEIGNHIDFVCRSLSVQRRYNPVNFNNGIGTNREAIPFFVSEFNAWLNGLNRNVPNSTAVPPTLLAVDFRAAGLLPNLPSELRDVITPKRMRIPMRRTATAGSALLENSSARWDNSNPLWIPSEVEVFGRPIRSSEMTIADQLRFSSFVQYPLFRTAARRVSTARDANNNRVRWWLLDPTSASRTQNIVVGPSGFPESLNCSTASINVVFGFRIA